MVAKYSLNGMILQVHHSPNTAEQKSQVADVLNHASLTGWDIVWIGQPFPGS